MKKEDLKKLALLWIKRSEKISKIPMSAIEYTHLDAQRLVRASTLEKCGIELLELIGEER